jgi:hypothetical protein
MDCIREEGHIVMTLEDDDLKRIDPEYDLNRFEGGMRIYVQGNVNSSL